MLIDARFAAPLVAQGSWEGVILEAPRGTGGFGYDALFWLPEQQQTAAQLSAQDKNRLSHRGKALAALRFRAHAARGMKRYEPRIARFICAHAVVCAQMPVL